ncbi:MAG: hypothetical protein U0V56_12510 [Actinomycetota bacterium]
MAFASLLRDRRSSPAGYTPPRLSRGLLTAPLLSGTVAAVVALAVGGWFMLRADGGLLNIAGCLAPPTPPRRRRSRSRPRRPSRRTTFRGAMYGLGGHA